MEPSVTAILNSWRGKRGAKRCQNAKEYYLGDVTKRKTVYRKAALTVEQNLQARRQKSILNLALVKYLLFIYMHMSLKYQGERQNPCLFGVQTRAHAGRWVFNPQHPSSHGVDGPAAWLEICVKPSLRDLSY